MNSREIKEAILAYHRTLPTNEPAFAHKLFEEEIADMAELHIRYAELVKSGEMEPAQGHKVLNCRQTGLMFYAHLYRLKEKVA
jgi:hypothetical protein